MNKEIKFYICKHCGNIITKVEDSKVNVVCCGEEMSELIPNTVDAVIEKHVPVVEQNKNTVTVKVGSIEHPMTEEHHISWVVMLTSTGFQIKYLDILKAPVVSFETNEKVISVYEYCNLHGLWKKEM